MPFHVEDNKKCSIEEAFPAIDRVQNLLKERRLRCHIPFKETHTESANSKNTLLNVQMNVSNNSILDIPSTFSTSPKKMSKLTSLASDISDIVAESLATDIEQYSILIDHLHLQVSQEYANVINEIEADIDEAFSVKLLLEPKESGEKSLDTSKVTMELRDHRKDFLCTSSQTSLEIDGKGIQNDTEVDVICRTNYDTFSEIVELPIESSDLQDSACDLIFKSHEPAEMSIHEVEDAYEEENSTQYDKNRLQKEDELKHSLQSSRAKLLTEKFVKAVIIQRTYRFFLYHQLYPRGRMQWKASRVMRRRNSLKRFFVKWNYYIDIAIQQRNRWTKFIHQRLQFDGPCLHHSFKAFNGREIFSREGKHVMAISYRKWRLKAVIFATWMQFMCRDRYLYIFLNDEEV